jgi:hypothetical protein
MVNGVALRHRLPAEQALRGALQEQGLTNDQIRSALLNRLQTRALVTGDFKLAAQAINLDLRIERNLITQRRLDLQERQIRALERRKNPKPVTPRRPRQIRKGPPSLRRLIMTKACFQNRIGVGMRDKPHPSLQTGLAGLPHPAIQSVGS